MLLKIFLTNDELGNTVDEVEALIKKHEAFEMQVAGQEEKVSALELAAERLTVQEGVDKNSVENILEEVLER